MASYYSVFILTQNESKGNIPFLKALKYELTVVSRSNSFSFKPEFQFKI